MKGGRKGRVDMEFARGFWDKEEKTMGWDGRLWTKKEMDI